MMYQNNKNKAFYVIIKYLQTFLYYPTSNSERCKGSSYKKLSLLIRGMTCFTWIANILHLLLFSLKNRVYEVIADDMVMVSALFGCMFACIFFYNNNTVWTVVFRRLTEFDRFGKPYSYEQIMRDTNFFTVIYIVYCNLGAVVYTYIRLRDNTCELLLTKGFHDICNVVTPLWLPTSNITNITRIIINSYQVICLICYIPPAALLCSLPWVCTEVVGAQIDHLNETLQGVFDKGDYNMQKDKLKFCVQYHIRILKTCSILSGAVQRTVSHVCIVAALIFGCIETQVLRKFSEGNLQLLLGWIITPLFISGSAVFFLCHAGQNLKNKTLSIGEAAYASKWYNADPKLGKSIKIIIMRANKPSAIESVPFGHIDYALFVTILKTSYTYLTILNVK